MSKTINAILQARSQPEILGAKDKVFMGQKRSHLLLLAYNIWL